MGFLQQDIEGYLNLIKCYQDESHVICAHIVDLLKTHASMLSDKEERIELHIKEVEKSMNENKSRFSEMRELLK